MIGWLLVPYKPHPRRARARYCAIDEQTREINDCGGTWSEVEFGGQAIVRVRASSALLSQLARRYSRLSETEARRRATHREFEQLARAVPAAAPSIEQTSLLAHWRGVGFTLGWRLPADVVAWAVRLGLEPDRYAAALTQLCTLYGRAWADLYERLMLTQGRVLAGGAFPTTGVLDAFTRGDAADLGANWTPNQFGGSVGPRLVGNACGPDSDDATNNYCDAFWNVATFGPDVECFMTLTGNAGGAGYECHIRLTGLDGSPDGYMISGQDGGGNDNQLYRINQNAQTALGSASVQDMSNGDSVGVDRIANDLHMFRKPSGGSWAQLGSTVNDGGSALSQTAGNIGLNIQRSLTAHRFAPFNGGTVVVAGGHPAARRIPKSPLGLSPWAVRRM
jgi:hypothetical protein